MLFQVQPNNVDTSAPLIYMWEIRNQEGVLLGRYVGKAKRGANRPLTHYSRNVANILAGKPYRRGNPLGFRRIHKALAEADKAKHRICLVYLCNVESGEDINQAEQRCIKEWDSMGNKTWQLNG